MYLVNGAFTEAVDEDLEEVGPEVEVWDGEEQAGGAGYGQVGEVEVEFGLRVGGSFGVGATGGGPATGKEGEVFDVLLVGVDQGLLVRAQLFDFLGHLCRLLFGGERADPVAWDDGYIDGELGCQCEFFYGGEAGVGEFTEAAEEMVLRPRGGGGGG